jgi:hypothetical protein
MRLVPGRWPGTATALAGVALALPSVTAPTWQQTVAAREQGEVVARQLRYSWGRVEFEGPVGVPLGTTENRVALAAFVALLVLAAAAAAAWLLLRGRAALLAPLGVALLAGRLAATVAERHGRVLAPETRPGPGLSYLTGSTDAGWYETGALLALAAALAIMVVGLFRAPVAGPVVRAERTPARLAGPEVSLVDAMDAVDADDAVDAVDAEVDDATRHGARRGGRRRR